MIQFTAEHIEVSVAVAAALAAFGCKDDTRVNLGVGVDQSELSATDGHRCVIFSRDLIGDEKLDAAHYQGKRWSRRHVDTLVKVARAQKQDTVRLVLSDATGSGRFPPVHQVVPSYGRGGGADGIGVDPIYLSDLGKVASACECKYIQLTQTKGPLDPIGFKAEGARISARVVIMPARV